MLLHHLDEQPSLNLLWTSENKQGKLGLSVTHSSLELLSPPYLNTHKAPPHPARCWWRERQNRGAYNTSSDERQTKGGGLERERAEKERERLIKNTCCWGVQRGPEQNPIITCLFLSTTASILHYKRSIHRDSHSNRTESPALQHTYLFNSSAWMRPSDQPMWKSHSQLPFSFECLRTLIIDIFFFKKKAS